MAIDYRRVNAVTLMDPATVPHAQQSLAQLGGQPFLHIMRPTVRFLATSRIGNLPRSMCRGWGNFSGA